MRVCIDRFCTLLRLFVFIGVGCFALLRQRKKNMHLASEELCRHCLHDMMIIGYDSGLNGIQLFIIVIIGVV